MSSAQQKQLRTGALAQLQPVTAAAVVTAFVMYPVDIVRALKMANSSSKTQLTITQLVQKFHQRHGLKGFVTQGVGAEMMRATVSRVIKFWLQPIFHKSVFGKDQGKGSAFSKGVAGALATVPEILAISPFENAKLAKQLDTKGRFPGGTLQVFQHLIKTRGVLGLYTGYFGMQLRQAAWTGGFFMSVDTFKSYVSPYLGQGSMTNTVAGFMAGVFGTCLNCWCDVCRTGIQKARIAETFDPKIEKPKHNLQFFLEGPSDFFSQAQKILHERGFKGLYAGFLVKSVYLGGSGALLATLIPLFKKSLNVE